MLITVLSILTILAGPAPAAPTSHVGACSNSEAAAGCTTYRLSSSSICACPAKDKTIGV